MKKSEDTVTHEIRPAGSVVLNKDGAVVSREQFSESVLHKDEEQPKKTKDQPTAKKE